MSVDRKKVIIGLECCKDMHTAGPGYAQGCIACPYADTKNDGMNGYSCIRKLYDDAQELLKAQEPREPVRMNHTENKYRDHYRCPICKEDLSYDQNYCPDCGRAVKWE